MNVSADMLHPDLQPFYGRVRFFTGMFKRRWLTKLVSFLSRKFTNGKNVEGLHCEEIEVPSSDGQWKIRTRVYKPLEQDGPLPILVYIHGGGYLIGNPEMAGDGIKRFIETRPCVVVAPDYRKAWTQPFPAGFNDCYDTLLWAVANAAELAGNPDQIMVAGHSAGGGLTAAVTLRARDTGDVNIAFQMPIYPMIDDQQPDDQSRRMMSPIWDTETNRIGWGAYLEDLLARGEEIPAYAAAARNRDYANFPPTITFVGTLEPFYWETQDYVKSLREAGIEVAYEEFENCFHAFEAITPEAEVSQSALAFTYSAYADFYDRFLPRA